MLSRKAPQVNHQKCHSQKTALLRVNHTSPSYVIDMTNRRHGHKMGTRRDMVDSLMGLGFSGLDPTEELLAYWDDKRAGRAMPTTYEIDPTEIVHLLPELVLWDVAEEISSLRQRMVGADLIHATGVNTAGHTIDEISDLVPSFKETNVFLNEVLATGRPHRRRGVLTTPDGRMYPYLGVAMPLGDTRGSITMLMDYMHLLPVTEVEQHHIL